MPLEVVNGPIIAAGESLSSGIDCTAGEVVRLTMPAQWTPANLSFQISSDGEGYNDLYALDGREIMIPCVAGAGILLQGLFAHGIAFLKFRSGSAAAPTIQPVQRDFSVALLVP